MALNPININTLRVPAGAVEEKIVPAVSKMHLGKGKTAGGISKSIYNWTWHKSTDVDLKLLTYLVMRHWIVFVQFCWFRGGAQTLPDPGTDATPVPLVMRQCRWKCRWKTGRLTRTAECVLGTFAGVDGNDDGASVWALQTAELTTLHRVGNGQFAVAVAGHRQSRRLVLVILRRHVDHFSRHSYAPLREKFDVVDSEKKQDILIQFPISVLFLKTHRFWDFFWDIRLQKCRDLENRFRGPSRSLEMSPLSAYDFLMTFYNNYGSISCHFWDIQCRKIS